jgi:hypothetical protein
VSAPVFGREPSRPLPRDDDSEPSSEIDLTEGRSGSERDRDDPTEPMTIEPDEGESDEPDAAEPTAGGSDVSEGDETDEREPDAAAGSDVSEGDETGEREPDAAAGSDVSEGDEAGQPRVPEGFEAAKPEADAPEVPVGFKLAEAFEAANPGADKTEPSGYPTTGDTDTATESPPVGAEVVPVVVEAEGVSAEPEHEPAGLDASEMWIEVQAQFVDDPQAATAEALRVLRESLDGLAPAGASTEDLRVAFRRYRAAYFDLAEN